jgi:putative inorganic carbon (hco3(-)) transporter
MRAETSSPIACANPEALEFYSRNQTLAWSALAAVCAPVQAAMANPVALYLATLSIILFRPPDVELYSVDRIAFAGLVFVVLLRTLDLRQGIFFDGWLMLPMAGLSGLATASALSHPYETSTWSVMTAKFVVPFAMFWVAGMTFRSEGSLRWLERFCLLVLAYLIFTAIASLAGIDELVFPPYILDESLGTHTDRARGPFLQAVANGVTLNLLGLLAIDGFRRKRLRWIWLGLLLPLSVAIAATKTRAVWLSFAVSVLWLLLRDKTRLRPVWLLLTLAAFSGLFFLSSVVDGRGTLEGRLRDRNTVEFRTAAYQAGWEMFAARPLAGWGTAELQATLADRIRGFRGQSFAIHNTYLEILLEHGICGIGLYVWLMVALFRLSKKRPGDTSRVGAVRRLWPLLLGVYLVNAMFVVMNYQFVNGLLFTFAGVLAAGSHQAYCGDAPPEFVPLLP